MPTSRGSCARRASSPRTFRRTRARSTRCRSCSRIPPPTGDSSRRRPPISGRSAARRFSPRSTKALAASDPRVRRAAALALGNAGEASASETLRRAVETDRAEDVVAAAEISLGRLRAPGTKEYLMRQLARDSRWWDSVRLGALIGLGKLGDPSLGATFAKYTAPGYVQDVRIAAMNGWLAAAPNDPNLAASLRTLASDRNRSVRLAAIQGIGKLHRSRGPGVARGAAEGSRSDGRGLRDRRRRRARQFHRTGRRGSVACRDSWKVLVAAEELFADARVGAASMKTLAAFVAPARLRRGRRRAGSHHDPRGGLDRRRSPVLFGRARLQRVEFRARCTSRRRIGASSAPARLRRP